jgi:integrase-like protein
MTVNSLWSIGRRVLATDEALMTSGAHQFRHGLATEMLRQGASLSEIGELLGHRHPQTTKIYTKVRHQGIAYAGFAVAGRCAMNTLRQAVHEYLSLRRSLGFKLQDAGKGLLEFVTFMGTTALPTSPRHWRSLGLNNP